MNFMMYQNKMSLRIDLVMGEGLVIGMSRVRIPLRQQIKNGLTRMKRKLYRHLRMSTSVLFRG